MRVIHNFADVIMIYGDHVSIYVVARDVNYDFVMMWQLFLMMWHVFLMMWQLFLLLMMADGGSSLMMAVGYYINGWRWVIINERPGLARMAERKPKASGRDGWS